MEEIAVALQKREVTGKAVKQLRSQGLVPAVIHDHGKDSIIVMGQYVDLVKAYQKAGKHHPVSIKADGKEYMAIIKTADFDPKKHELRHIVFNSVKANETVTTDIPIHIKYDGDNDASPAERAGLVVLNQLETVEVDALMRYLPEALYFDGEKLVEVGDHLTVADLIVPEHVTVKTDPTHPIVTVFEPKALAAANDAAGGTDDEVTETENSAGETIADTVESTEQNADNAAKK